MLGSAWLCLKIVAIAFKFIGTEIRRALQIRRVRNRAIKYGSTPYEERTHSIVIIGASFAGHYAARLLVGLLPPDSKYRVIVIEPNSHFHFTWVLPRFCVAPGGHEHKAFVPYGKYTPGPDGAVRWIKDRATTITETAVGLQDSEESIPYDYLIIATGGTVTAGLPSRVNSTEKAEGVRLMQAMQERVAKAETVVVVGGGAAGVEVATDAKSLYPHKKIILVHPRPAVMHRFGKQLQDTCLEGLKKLDVEVILEDRVMVADDENNYVQLRSGRIIPCDFFINCAGQKPNSSIVSTLSPTSISSSGHIDVKPTLQLVDEKFQNIYACGDVIDVGVPTPNARSAMSQALVAVENVMLAIKGKAPTHEYKHNWVESFIKVTLGFESAVTHMSDGRYDLSIRGKGADMSGLAAHCWKQLGQVPFADADEKSPTE